MRDEGFEELVVLRRERKRNERARHGRSQEDVGTFFYDLVIIVAGIAGTVILLRLLVQALAA